MAIDPSIDPSVERRLDYVDQALFLGLRATGQAAAMQMVWVYDDAVDWDELRRFHRDFGFGLVGRLIEPSVLPVRQAPLGVLDSDPRHLWTSSPNRDPAPNSAIGSTNAPSYPSIRSTGRPGTWACCR